MGGGHREIAELILCQAGHLYVCVIPRHHEAEHSLLPKHERLRPLSLYPGPVNCEAEPVPGVAALGGTREPDQNNYQVIITVSFTGTLSH